MRRVEDLSQREVAARLGIGEAMVEKHIAKAMCRLADAFGEAQTAPVAVKATGRKEAQS
jgi:RNA polymerase sigma-70 factor (ECF subfamily)